MNLFNLAIIIFAIGFMIWTVWNYFMVKQAAQFIDNSEFKAMMFQSQIVDVREPRAFKEGHILGARNFPLAQLKASLGALRKDKPILLYDTRRGQSVARAVLLLKKEGFTQLYVLKDGIDYWDGKIK